MRFNIRQNYYQSSVQRTRRSLEPVIDKNLGTLQRDSINIQKNCGPDNICIPDLRLEVHSNDTHLIGSEDLLEFDVKVLNLGEDAFESSFFMTVPKGMTFRKAIPIGEKSETQVTCTPPSAATNDTLKCEIGNPLLSNKAVNFRVILLPTSFRELDDSVKYEFFMNVNSTNPELDGTDFDNMYKKTVGISVATNLTVKGVAIDTEILYNTTGYVPLENATHEEQIGEQVVHIYEIRNSGGPSTIKEAEVYFIWPFETSSSHDPLLYLLDQPETSKNMQCDSTKLANSRQLKLNRTKSFLVSQGAIDQSNLNIGSYHSTGYASDGKSYTAEEESKFEQDSFQEAAGDASDVHAARANQAAQVQGGGEYRQFASNSNTSPGAVVYTSRLNQSRHSPERYDDFDAQHRSQASNVYRAGVFNTRGGGVGPIRKLDDFSSEGSVNHEITGGHSHGQIQTSQGAQGSQRAHTSQSSQSSQNSQNSQSFQSAAGSSGRRRMQSQQDGEAFRPGLITGATQLENKDEFNVGTLELNALGPRENVDDEIRRHGNAAHFAHERQNVGHTGYYSGSSTSTPYHQGGIHGGGMSSRSSYSHSQGGSQGGSQSGFRSTANSFQGKLFY